MERHGSRRGTYHVSRRSRKNSINELDCIATEALTEKPEFPLLDLPVHIIYDILSRLPAKDIFQCRCVCQMFLRLLKDPYFAKIHLAKAPLLRTNLILQENIGKWGFLHFFTFDLVESTFTSCSSDDQILSQWYVHHGLHALTKLDAEFSFRTQRLTLVGSCNGLLCIYFDSPSKPFYGICNPILCESVKLPCINSSVPVLSYVNHSGFGFCSRSKKYKVVSFTSADSKRMVAGVHTLGSDSWRTIEDCPSLKKASFDPFLNGYLHWITDSTRPSELITAFDLETEKFGFIPLPAHFSAGYVSKVSWIDTGVLRGCLCICYIYEDSEFEVWVMREYGVKESWRKEFSIDLKFYCKLRVEDLCRPIKFLSDGDMWFISSCDALVSFSPRKRTFRELRSTGRWSSEVTAHDLSFVSLKDVVGAKSRKVKNLRVERPRILFGV